MYRTLDQKLPERRAKLLVGEAVPVSIEWSGDFAPAEITFSDGCETVGSCIRCLEPPCIEYQSEELLVTGFEDFPADQNPSVCPTSAIAWPFEEEAPVVDSDACILCGLCAVRCPVRAIHLTEDGAYINDKPNDRFAVGDQAVTVDVLEAITRIFADVPERGSVLVEDDDLLTSFYERMQVIASEQGAQFPNHLARNLLNATGVGVAMRRRGDTNIRMDLVIGSAGVERGTAEVELGVGVLDAPRNMLDNLAVLSSRYSIPVSSIFPLIVTLALPNLRSEYWQVVKDIKDVVDVNLNTITIGALVLAVWNRAFLDLDVPPPGPFYLDADDPSAVEGVEALLGRELEAPGGGYPGCFSPTK